MVRRLQTSSGPIVINSFRGEVAAAEQVFPTYDFGTTEVVYVVPDSEQSVSVTYLSSTLIILLVLGALGFSWKDARRADVKNLELLRKEKQKDKAAERARIALISSASAADGEAGVTAEVSLMESTVGSVNIGADVPDIHKETPIDKLFDSAFPEEYGDVKWPRR